MFSAGIDSHPAAVVRVRSSEEVAAVLGAVRGADVELAVCSGRHGTAGLSTVDDGIVLDTRRLDAFELDPETSTVWVGAGLTAGEVTARLGEHGLAVGFGDTGSVGVAGITLGGGVGFLSRLYGLTVDNLLAVEVVTASGEVLVADETHHEDLFWALRGGGGGFGVVTRLRLQAHELPQVYGGMLLLPATPETVVGAVRHSQQAPRELTTIVNVMTCPPMPFVPAEAHGSLVVFVMLTYAGSAEDGEAAVAGLRGLATPVVDMVRAMPYAGMFPPAETEYRPHARSRNLYLSQVDESLAALVLRRLEESDASMRAVQLRPLGGAIDDVASDATAYPHRGLALMANVANFVDGPETVDAREQWAAELARELDQGLGAQYVNFVGPEGDSEGRVAYPTATRERLLAVKERYDPDTVFSRCYLTVNGGR
jgi:FAD/FMN-containing dehydrogenase